MPDTVRSPEPPPAAPPTRPAATGWRANVRALGQALRPGAAREPAHADTDDAALLNPLRRPDETRSLFGEILDWMLAPLLLLWPLTVTITYVVAQGIAAAPYDRLLGENVQQVASFVVRHGDRVTLQLPLPVRDVLRADADETLYYMVLGLRGEFVAGDADMPLPPDDEPLAPGRVRLRSDTMRGSEVRIASVRVVLADRPDAQPVLVQVAETLERREQLANELVRGVIVPQAIVLPIAVALVWFGLARGLVPLRMLQRQIRRRRPDDLSPIDPRRAPEELAPLVTAFNELLERLAQNIETQKRFTAHAAHQMKTPLAGLRMQAELALRETDPQGLRRSLRQIAAASERATHLINQLLALARAEHQATDLAAFRLVDLAAEARDRVHDLVPQALARRIDLGLEAPARGAHVVGLPVLLRELVANLVDNAIRYTPNRGSVTVRVRSDEGTVVLEVDDTGPGIPAAERGLVFERFYRVLGTNIDGSGLGLAIVREIAEQHGATVQVSDNPDAPTLFGPGTRVAVTFPAAAAGDTGAAAAASAPAAGPPGGPAGGRA